jgi:hypothetical protein
MLKLTLPFQNSILSEMKYFLPVIIIIVLSASPLFSQPVKTLLTDIDIAYIYQNESDIDWPLIYYLGIENGCRIEMINLLSGASLELKSRRDIDYPISRTDIFIPDTNKTTFDSVMARLYPAGAPDIVVTASNISHPELIGWQNYLLRLPYDSLAVFNIMKYYRAADEADSNLVYLNRIQYVNRKYAEMYRLAFSLFESPFVPREGEPYSKYRLMKCNKTSLPTTSQFLDDIERLKLDRMIAKYVPNLYDRSAMEQSSRNYLIYLQKANIELDDERMESLLTALGIIKKIKNSYLTAGYPVTSPLYIYLSEAIRQVTAVIFSEAGVNQSGKAYFAETSEGRKLKFISRINNGGSYPVRSGRIIFKPGNLDTTIIVDTLESDIGPHNSLVREYAVDLENLAINSPAESLIFIGQVLVKENPIDFIYYPDIPDEPSLKVEFAPNFLVIRPFPKLQIDRLVDMGNLNLLIRKPVNFAAKVTAELIPPPGVKIGAIEEEIVLERGNRGIIFNLPMAINSHLGPDKEKLIVNLKSGNKQLAADTAYIRLADFKIDENAKIALLPDSAGIIEDILIMTGAYYRTISPRFLVTGDIDFYDIVIFGSGCSLQNELIGVANTKLKKFMEYGGTMIVFGQPDSRQYTLLPIPIGPALNRIPENAYKIINPADPLFSQTYKIDASAFLANIISRRSLRPANIFSGDKVIGVEGDVSLLTVTKLGRGKLIYCGFPLPEMFRELDTVAIKFFSNLINYAGQ